MSFVIISNRNLMSIMNQLAQSLCPCCNDNIPLISIGYHHLENKYAIDISCKCGYQKKNLLLASFIGSFLVLISGVIFLSIAIMDENIDVELAFS